MILQTMMEFDVFDNIEISTLHLKIINKWIHVRYNAYVSVHSILIFTFVDYSWTDSHWSQSRPFCTRMRSVCYFYNDVAHSVVDCSTGRSLLSFRELLLYTQPRENMAEQASGFTRQPQHDGKVLSVPCGGYCVDVGVLVVGLRPVRPRISQKTSPGWQYWQMHVQVSSVYQRLAFSISMIDLCHTASYIILVVLILTCMYSKGQCDDVAPSRIIWTDT